MHVVRRFPFLGVLMVAYSLAVAGEAVAQCLQCDPFMRCQGSAVGARFCVQTSISCSMLVPCSNGPSRDGDGTSGFGPLNATEDLTTFTLFDAIPGAVRPRSVRQAGAAALALGDEMRASAGGAAATIAEAGVAHGRDFAAVFADDAGEGFTLRRAVEPGGIRLEVREVRGDMPGAVLASEVLAEGDRLVVPVHTDGHDRVLVLQARTLPGVVARFDLLRLRRSLTAIGRLNAGRVTPLLKPRAY